MAEEVQLSQPQELFDESMLPVREDLVQAVQARSFLAEQDGRKKVFTHSGRLVIKRLMNDEELCEAICTALYLGLSARLVGKRFGISPKSVANIREAMTNRGELASVRLRIQAKLDRVIELGLEYWEEGILTGTIPPGSNSIPVLAAIDKKGQLEVGIVPGTGRTEVEITADQVRAEYEALKAAADLVSVGSGHNRVNINVAPAQDTALDTTGPVLEAVEVPSPAAPTARQAPPSPGGGGGVDASPAPPQGRGVGPSENSS